MNRLKAQYGSIRLLGVGGAFGFVDSDDPDSGQTSESGEDTRDDDDDDESDDDDASKAYLILPPLNNERRPSKQFAMHDIAI